MTTRPRVHRREVVSAIDRSARRRVEIDDPSREQLPDAPNSDPREVIDYLARHTDRNVPRRVVQADVCDALVLVSWLWWEDRRRELRLLKVGIECGLPLAQIGSQFGIGKQGVRDRIDRLEGLLRFDQPDEKLARAERRRERAKTAGDSPEEVWLRTHTEEVLTIAQRIVATSRKYPLRVRDREWLDELEVDVQGGVLTPAMMAILGLAVGELRVADVLASEIAPTSGSIPRAAAGRLLARADELRSQFAAIR
jgi:hypothetical protein